MNVPWFSGLASCCQEEHADLGFLSPSSSAAAPSLSMINFCCPQINQSHWITFVFPITFNYFPSLGIFCHPMCGRVWEDRYENSNIQRTTTGGWLTFMFVFDDTMVLMAMMLKVVLNACSCLVYSPLGGKTDRIAGSPVYRGCKILDTTASHKLKPANKFDSNNPVWCVLLFLCYTAQDQTLQEMRELPSY